MRPARTIPGTARPDPADLFARLEARIAALERSQGLPTFTTSSRPAATAVRAGFLIWNETTAKVQVSNGSAWLDLH